MPVHACFVVFSPFSMSINVHHPNDLELSGVGWPGCDVPPNRSDDIRGSDVEENPKAQKASLAKTLDLHGVQSPVALCRTRRTLNLSSADLVELAHVSAALGGLRRSRPQNCPFERSWKPMFRYIYIYICLALFSQCSAQLDRVILSMRLRPLRHRWTSNLCISLQRALELWGKLASSEISQIGTMSIPFPFPFQAFPSCFLVSQAATAEPGTQPPGHPRNPSAGSPENG